MAVVGDPCPLCEGTSAGMIWSISYQNIWRELEEKWATTLPASFRAPFDEVGEARLFKCGACALRYFSPILPGDAFLYEELSKNPRYFVDQRWEFDEVLMTAKPTDHVADLGAGTGAFVRRAAQVVAGALGCDHGRFGERPPEHVVNLSFADFAAEHANRFDTVVSFHVLEHVSSVDVIVKPAIRALKPGGRLFLSTPDRERTARDDFEVLDCPPHHISRWGSRQFEYLGEVHGLQLKTLRYEPYIHPRGWRRMAPKTLLYALGLAVHRSRNVKLQPPSGLPIGAAPEKWPRGSAILAEYEKPDR